MPEKDGGELRRRKTESSNGSGRPFGSAPDLTHYGVDDKEPEDEKNHGMPHESRGAEEWGLMAFSNVLRLLFVVVPDRLCDIGNAVQSMITLGYLYIIWQAVAMVWLFIIFLIANMMMRVAECGLTGCSATEEITPGKVLLIAYVYYAVLWSTFLIAKGCYDLGWESYSEFPQLQRVLGSVQRSMRTRFASEDESSHGHSSAEDTPARNCKRRQRPTSGPSGKDLRKERIVRILRRRTSALLGPLVIVIFCSCALFSTKMAMLISD
jgi:hypothetical protein